MLTAHRALHDAGVLHRDISVSNILLNPKGEEGNRGVLIDFDHAIRIDNKSPYSTQLRIVILHHFT
jgi:serine/threonine protein kinase